MNLTTPGAFALTDSMTGNQIAGFVRKPEQLGYRSFWFPEAFGRDPRMAAVLWVPRRLRTRRSKSTVYRASAELVDRVG